MALYRQLETKVLEEQTRKMQDKLAELKRQIEEQKKIKTEMYNNVEIGALILLLLDGKTRLKQLKDL